MMCVTADECVNAKHYLYTSDDETVRRCYEEGQCTWVGHRCITLSECSDLGGKPEYTTKCDIGDECLNGKYEYGDEVCIDKSECLSEEGRLLYENVNITHCLDDFDDCTKKGGFVLGGNCYTRD